MSWRGFLAGLLTLSITSAISGQVHPLAPTPRWATLDRFQHTLTQQEFAALLRGWFSPDGGMGKYLRLTPSCVEVYQDIEQTEFLWRMEWAEAAPLSQSPPPKTIAGLTICLDPGHIGGEWAKLEERWFRLGEDPPIIEWDLNYLVALQVEQLLLQKGARVVWTKRTPEPVTSHRPETLRDAAMQMMLREGPRLSADQPWDPATTLQAIARRSRILFYRAAEIRARAEQVNQQLRPDLTVCIHFNAASWGDPAKPELVPSSRLILFVHGAYTSTELVDEDMKFDLMRKLLQRDLGTELAVTRAMGQAYARLWPQWPPVADQHTPNMQADPLNPYVFARNLLANRVFDGPVVFAEGPYMNARDAYPRLQAGDYAGQKNIDGQLHRSLFAEYAEAIVEGIEKGLSSPPGNPPFSKSDTRSR